MLELADELTAPDRNLDKLTGKHMLWFDRFPIEGDGALQARLDLTNRARTSLFAWRGQFSPQLIEFFLSEFAAQGSLVVDPFVGSGTTLFEAAQLALDCIGAEINPAAVIMANSVQFVKLNRGERWEVLHQAYHLLERHLPVEYPDGLFATLYPSPKNPPDISARLKAVVREARNEPAVHNLIANILMRFMALPQQDMGGLYQAFKEHTRIIEQLPFNKRVYRVLHTDARALPIQAATVDLIITSPPYINVFNYHQNHRPVMELLGWDVLSVAKSEFGANRKHRSNRFLTVVQYALDLLAALREMRRVLKPEGRIILVIGRESNIRGIPFPNGKMIAVLAQVGAGLQLVLRQERKFKTKFGETIYEDILHLVPAGDMLANSSDLPRSIARHLLCEGLRKAPAAIQPDILAALNQASQVDPSPIFEEHTAADWVPKRERHTS